MKEGWEIKKLKEVCKLINGRAYKKAELLDSGTYPVLRVGNFFTNRNWYYSNLELPEDKYCDTDDLLYAWSASFGPRIWEGGKSIYHYHIWKVVPNLHHAHRDFLFHFFEWDKELIKNEQGTGTTMIHVGKGSMENRAIPVPPLAEQVAIVEVLDKAFAAIDQAKANIEQNIANAKELFQSKLNQIFSQKGEGWVEKSLGAITGGVSTGPFGSLLHKRDYIEDGIPLVNPAHITEVGVEPDYSKTVSEETASRLHNYRLSEGDIVIGRRGEMGRCAVVTENEDGWLCGTGSFIIKYSPSIKPEYLVRLLRSHSTREKLEAIAGGAVMKNLSNSSLSKFVIDVPPIETQEAILSQFNNLCSVGRQLESQYQTKLASLDELKKSILQKAFAGELT